MVVNLLQWFVKNKDFKSGIILSIEMEFFYTVKCRFNAKLLKENVEIALSKKKISMAESL